MHASEKAGSFDFLCVLLYCIVLYTDTYIAPLTA